MRRVAVMDLGSNSFRLVVFRYEPGGVWTVWDEVREPVRLSAGMGAGEKLQKEPVRRAVAAAARFARFCERTGVDQILAVGTSALRRAVNGAEVQAAIEAEGFPLRILDGREEAHYGALAILNASSVSEGFGLDMGGGSVQLMALADRGLAESASLPLGAVRVTEELLGGARASGSELKAVRSAAREQLSDLPWWTGADGGRLAAIGGSVRNLAGAAQKMQGLPNGTVQGFELDIEMVQQLVAELADRDVAQRGALPGINPDRGDVILAAAVVLETLMKEGGFNTLEITEAGLREGLFYERYFEGQSPPVAADVRAQAVRTLLLRANADGDHSARVTEHALAIYDGLVEAGIRPGGDGAERSLLRAGAALHDIGRPFGYNGRQKDARYLILSDGLPGFTQRETALVSQLVRYATKGTPSAGELGALAAEGDDDRVLLLAAIVRVAEQLDRTRAGRVAGVRVRAGDDAVRLLASGTAEAEVELREAGHASELLARAVGREITVERGDG